MPADDTLLFIDSNKYLDLYRTVSGKKLLALLGEQSANIFVTQQVVDEVHRNKILVAVGFLNDKFKELTLQTFNVPDHLFGTSAGQSKSILEQMSEIFRRINKANEDVAILAFSIMEQIGRSEDEVSKSLAPIFAKAVAHSPDEFQRAKERKERGNPPGKNTNALGDQLTWEQLLTEFVGKRRLWIISRDGDYGTFYEKRGFLNHFLNEELRKINPDSEVFLFDDIVGGIKHFSEQTGTKADKLPTAEETQEIKKEEEALPPVDAYIPIVALNRAWRGMPTLPADIERALRGIPKLSPEFERALRGIPKLSPEFERALRGIPKLTPELERALQGTPKLTPELERALQGMPKLTPEMERASRETPNISPSASNVPSPAVENLSDKPKEDK